MPINFYISETPYGERQSSLKAFLTDLENEDEVLKMLRDSGSDECVVAFHSCRSEKHPNAVSVLAQLAFLNSEYEDSIGQALEELVLAWFYIGLNCGKELA